MMVIIKDGDLTRFIMMILVMIRMMMVILMIKIGVL